MRSALSAVTLSLLLIGCQEQEQPLAGGSMFEGREETGAASRPAPPTQPASGAPAGQQLTWAVPESWQARQPANRMRKAEYRVPGEAGEAELAVFYFGPGQGGSPMDNAVRWARQFEIAGGGDPAGAMTTRKMEVGGRQVLLVELEGTYKSGGPMMGAPKASHPGYALLGAVVEGPDAPWFFKLTGPSQTVAEARDGFLSMVESARASAEDSAEGTD